MGTIVRKIEDLEPSIYIGNTAGWVVSIANTVAGGDLVSIANSSGWVVNMANTQGAYAISNSAGWIVNVANTGGLYTLANSSNINIANSAGWLVGQADTSQWYVKVVNSTGWVMSQSNTSSIVQISSGSVYVVNTNPNVTITSGSVYVVNTVGTVAVSGTPTVIITNTANWGVKVTSGSVYVVNTNSVVQVSSGSFYMVNTGGAYSYDSSTAYDVVTPVTPKFAVIATTNSGNNTIVAPLAAKATRVLSVFLISNAANNVIWQSDSSSAVGLTGTAFLAANVGYVLPFNPHGWFETGTNTLLNLNVSAVNSIGGCITYIQTS